MTEQAAAAAVEAPVVDPATEAPAEAQESPVQQAEVPDLEQPRSKAQARRNVAKRMAARAEAAEKARSAHRDQPRVEAGTPEGGQFKADEGGEGSPSESESVAGLAAPDASESSASAKAGVDGDPSVDQSAAGDGAPPAGQIDVPLPDDHPLRARGLTHIRALESQEHEVRAGINAIAERRQLREELKHERAQRAISEARQKALTGDVKSYEADFVYQQVLEQIREAPGFGDEVAEEIRLGLEALNAQRLQQAESSASEQVARENFVSEWSDQVMAHGRRLLTVWGESGELGHRLGALMEQYCDQVDQRNEREGTNRRPDVREFYEWVQPAYRADPRVQAKLQQMRDTDKNSEHERIRREERAKLEAERREKAEEAKARHSVLPPLNRSGSASTRPVTEPSEKEREAPRGPGTLKRAAKARLRERLGSR